MKAITFSHYGDPEVLALTDVDEPRVVPGEVLVRFRSASGGVGILAVQIAAAWGRG